MSFNFADKRILVTGGTRGIGRGIAEAFLEAGARVAVNGSSLASVTQAITEIGAGNRLISAPGSLATVEGCRQAVAAAHAGLGGLDVLVNNAGAEVERRVEDTSEEDWDRVIDTNLKGVFFVTRFALPHLRAARGNIVNIASVNGLIGVPNFSIYCASKAGVINMTRAHALEFAPDVRVNTVCPGGVDTDMLRGVATRLAGSVEAGYRLLAEVCAAQKRIAHVREIAGPVLYLASDLASFVTGSIHVVDGGETID
jgi:NAD(P)-dependent dehydrogenase (short-subunit alcohol dehydrogenase family)